MLLNLTEKNRKTWLQAIDKSMIFDRHRLSLSLKRNKKIIDEPESKQSLEWQQRLSKSIEIAERRAQKVPVIEYDSNLPVAGKKDDILELIRNHQIVVIAGETGSGKTTQIPKICLEAGRGVFGKIGCTQPRRLAARSVAERVAEELHSEIGDLVGYQVRFMEQSKQHSLIKVMTDGILLAEIQNDPFLNQYDTIIIDEAHERSLNIDFLLGILKQLCKKRPELKVIVTSATIDTGRFADHFTINGVRPPIIEVSGRTYPVELRYRPLVSYEDDAGNVIEQDVPTAIADAVEELSAEDPIGDILVFQIGERDIKETVEVLRKRQLKNTELIPLYARLSMAEQNKVFQLSQKRRIILSTNVAETSLTVPGIKYVIDPGQVRISRYSVRSKVQRLPIEKISQASANQRKGRCGRVSEGVCIRLYDEEDFNSRPEFTDPEIHRTSLASIILTMTQLKLGKVKEFPFIEPPEEKALNDGYRTLQEIGALDEKRQITAEGKQIARLPIDPAMAKMVIEAEKNGILHEVIVIASALSIQDPRDINESTMQAARQKHKPLEDERSDFLFYLNLWHFYEHQRRHLSQSKLRKLCKTNFLSYLRMREWHELTVQLEGSLKRIGMTVNPLQEYETVKQGGEELKRLGDVHSIAVHRALLSGLLGNIAMRDDEKSYLGTRSTKLFIHPSSVLFKKKPKWLLSGELVETSKLFARNNAIIDIRWVEGLAGHLVKRSYSDPHWQQKAGQVGAYESVTLYGLPIVTRRHCNYGPINPKEAHKIFLRHALVQAQMRSKVEFYRHNTQMVAEVEQLESKLRRLDFLVDEEVIYQFYQDKIPEHIYSVPAFEKWARKAKQDAVLWQSLFLTREALLKRSVDESEINKLYPNQFNLRNQISIDVDYRFEPGKEVDGAVFYLPLSQLNVVRSDEFEWLTPALLEEKVTALIKSLPKALRKQFVPAPQYAQLALQEMSPDKREAGQSVPFMAQLVWALNRRAPQAVKLTDFAIDALPEHLKPYFVLQDNHGKKIAEGADLAALRDQYQHLVDKQIAKHSQHKTQSEQLINDWDFGDLADKESVKSQGATIEVYPGLQWNEKGIVLKRHADQEQAHASHAEAVVELLRMQLLEKEKYMQKKLPMKEACLCYAAYGTCAELTQQVIDRALFDLVQQPEQIRTQAQFEQTKEQLRLHWVEAAQKVAEQVQRITKEHQKIARQVKGKINPRWLASLSDIRQQLDHLIEKDFVRNTPEKWFKQMPRYLQALQKRLERIDIDPNKDQASLRELQPLLNRFEELQQNPAYRLHPAVVEVRWKLEELRISLFSQPLKTLEPVSIARLEKLLRQI